jgi:AmiR/NasT family two-component response regulator
MVTRDTIATAKGIVMAHHRPGADDTLQWLVGVSQRTNRKVHDLAQVIITAPDVVGSPT